MPTTNGRGTPRSPRAVVNSRSRPHTNKENTVPAHSTGPTRTGPQGLVRPLALAWLTSAALMSVSSAAHAQTAGTDPHLARNLAATCANCHGTDGQARGEMRPLAGMPAETLMAMLNGYRSGTLPATIMHQISKGYTDDQLRLIAGYFAAQKPRP